LKGPFEPKKSQDDFLGENGVQRLPGKANANVPEKTAVSMLRTL